MSSCWRILLVLSVVLATACSSLVAPYRQYEIRFDAPARPPLGGSPSDSEPIDSIAWLMHHRLDLPFPPDIKVYVFVNEAAFVDGLLARDLVKSVHECGLVDEDVDLDVR